MISIVFSCLFFVIENCEYTSHTTNNMGTLVKLQVIIIKNIFLNSNNLEETTISFDYFSLQCFIISYECNMTVDKITILPNTVHTKYLLKITSVWCFKSILKTHKKSNNCSFLHDISHSNIRSNQINNQQVTLKVCPIFI